MGFNERDFRELCGVFGISNEMAPYFLKTIMALEIYSELDCGGTAVLNALEERISTPKDIKPFCYIDPKSVKKGTMHVSQSYNMAYPVSKSLKFWKDRHYDFRLKYDERGDIFSIDISNKDDRNDEILKASAIFKSDGKYISQISILEKNNNYILKPLNDPEVMACLPLVNQRILKTSKTERTKD